MNQDNTQVRGSERSVDELAKELYPTISMNYCTGPIDYQNKNSVQNEFREAFKAGFLAAAPKGKEEDAVDAGKLLVNKSEWDAVWSKLEEWRNQSSTPEFICNEIDDLFK